MSGERSEPTSYTIARFADAQGRPCEGEDEAAVSVEVVEYDAQGGQLARTYARLAGVRTCSSSPGEREPIEVTLGLDGLPEIGRDAAAIVAGIEALKRAGRWPPPVGPPRPVTGPGGSPPGSPLPQP